MNSENWNLMSSKVGKSLSDSLSRYWRAPSMYSTNVDVNDSFFSSKTPLGLKYVICYRQQRSRGKVIFLHVSVILSTGGVHPSGRHPPRQTSPLGSRGRHPPPQVTATEADGTHPTGMHSCSINIIGNFMRN